MKVCHCSLPDVAGAEVCKKCPGDVKTAMMGTPWVEEDWTQWIEKRNPTSFPNDGTGPVDWDSTQIFI